MCGELEYDWSGVYAIVLQGCPIGHNCITPVIINCSCLRVFYKGFGAQPLRPSNKHQLENSLVLTCIASVPSWGVIQPWPGSVSQAGHTQVQ